MPGLLVTKARIVVIEEVHPITVFEKALLVFAPIDAEPFNFDITFQARQAAERDALHRTAQALAPELFRVEALGSAPNATYLPEPYTLQACFRASNPPRS